MFNVPMSNHHTSAISFFALAVTLAISPSINAQMHQDSSGRYVNRFGGNIYGNSNINPMANPTINPLANPELNPMVNPAINPMANPILNPLANPNLSPLGGNPKDFGY